jgi:hypothetical protein
MVAVFDLARPEMNNEKKDKHDQLQIENLSAFSLGFPNHISSVCLQAPVF